MAEHDRQDHPPVEETLPPEQDPVIVISEAELEAARNNQAARKLVKRALEEEQQMEREGRILR